MKTKLHSCYVCVWGLGPVHVCSLVGVSVSVRPYGSRLVDSVGLLVMSLTRPAHSIFLSTLPQGSLSSASVWLWVSASVSINFCMKPQKIVVQLDLHVDPLTTGGGWG